MMRVIVSLLGLGFIILHFWWILAALAGIGLVYMMRLGWRELQAGSAKLAAERAAIIARCDQQHSWVLDGDERGVYGDGDAPLPH